MSTALQALERMLLSQERREQSRVQESLSMMQLAQTAAYQQASLSQQKSYQDRQLAMAEQKQNIAVMGSNLELLSKYNDTMKIRSAQNFLQVSGLSALYSEFKDDDDGLTKAVKRLTGKDGWFDKEGIDRQIASDLVSATWTAYEEKEPRAIINIASKLHYIDETEKFADSYDKKLFKSFQSMGILTEENRDSMLKQFKTMRKSLDNEMKLTEELDEFTRGDYKIDREFDLIDESLKKIDLETPPPPPPPPSGFESILPPDKIIERFESEFVDLESKKNEILSSLEMMENIERDAKFNQSLGLEVSEKDIETLQNKDNVISELQSQLKNVDSKIKELSEITKKAKLIKEYGTEGYSEIENYVAPEIEEEKFPGSTGMSPGFGF